MYRKDSFNVFYMKEIMSAGVIIAVLLVIIFVVFVLPCILAYIPGKVGTMFRPLSLIHRFIIDKRAKVSNFSGAGTTPELQSYSYMMKTNPISGGNRPKPYDMEFSDRLEY